jgi:gas vesicle protein
MTIGVITRMIIAPTTGDKLAHREPIMKKITIAISLLSTLAGVTFTSCASDKTATESTTTTRQTTVTQPSATQTTTQTTRY